MSLTALLHARAIVPLMTHHASNLSSTYSAYPDTAFRLEYRPTYGLHSRDELRSFLDQLVETGVDAWWYSAAAKGSYPMFRSKHLPHRSDAVDTSFFRWLADEAHARGICLMSWEYLTTAPLLAEQHPEWAWKLFDWDGPTTYRDRQYVCWNSPYGQKLIDYSIEVVEDCGFDGIWFDGSFLHGHGMTGRYACCCDFCSRKYEEETGREIPATVDLNNQACREYFVWRGTDHMAYWRRLSEAVRKIKPKATVAFNYFNRFGNGLDSGTPLEHLGRDRTSMIVAEVGFHYHQTGAITKAMRAVSGLHRPEMWTYLADSHQAITAEPDPTPLIYLAEQCVTFGGDASYGIGREKLCEYRQTNAAIGQAIDRLRPFRDGKPLADVAVVLSNRTKDFGHVCLDGKDYDDTVVWQQVGGMLSILDGLHIQSELLLDNQLDMAGLKRHRVLVLPGVNCISDAAVEALFQYVEQGGVLLCIGECGERDEWGRMRSTNALDELLGITWRCKTQAVLETKDGRVYPGLGRPFLAGGDETVSCAFRLDRTPRYGSDGRLPPDPTGVEEALLFVRRSMGHGFAMQLAPDVAFSYANDGPHRRSRDLIRSILVPHITPLDTTASSNVTINRYDANGSSIVHLLEMPDALQHLRLKHPHSRFPDVYLPTSFPRHAEMLLSLPGRWTLEEQSQPKAVVVAEQGDSSTCIKIIGFCRHLALKFTSASPT